jgi:hypothetical protein
MCLPDTVDPRGPKGKWVPREWGEQYDRMNRWYARLFESKNVDERLVDDYYAFFTCCFHLKDWLKGDAALNPKIGEAAESHVNRDPWLRLCADVANGAKHLVVSRTSRVDPNARLKTGVVFVAPPIATEKGERLDAVMLHADGKLHIAIMVAGSCLREWNNFFVAWELVVKSSEVGR